MNKISKAKKLTVPADAEQHRAAPPKAPTPKTRANSNPMRANMPAAKSLQTAARPNRARMTERPTNVRLVTKATRAPSKLATVIALLREGRGASIERLIKATGWQAHSVRGAISGSLKKKLGLKVESTPSDEGRVYRIVK